MRVPFLLVAIVAGTGVLPGHAGEPLTTKAIQGKWNLDRTAVVTSSEAFKRESPEAQKKMLSAFVAIPTATLEITDSKLLFTEAGQTQANDYQVKSVAGRTFKLAISAGGKTGEMTVEVISSDTIRLVDASGQALFKRLDTRWEKADPRQTIQGRWRFDQQTVEEQSLGWHNMTPPPAAARSALDLTPPMDVAITATTLTVTVESAPGKRETEAGRYEVKSVTGRVVRIVRHAPNRPSEEMTLEVTDADALLFSIAPQEAGDPPLPLRRLVDPGPAVKK